MRFYAFLLLTGIFFTTLTSCTKEDSGSGGIVAQLDQKGVLYGSDDTAQNMDIYLPAGRDTGETKVLLFIHSGSWASGDKSEFNDAIATLRSQLGDFAIFNMNYRLALNPVNLYPAQINDVQTALNFITNKAAEFRVNPNKIALLGASAGAHLALLQAYKSNGEQKIKAVIDLFGPTDLTDLYNNHPFPTEAHLILVNFLGTTPSGNPGLYPQASPINYVSAQSVPTKIFHGDSDIVVPIGQSYALKQKLETNKVKVDMTVYPGEGHGWFDNNLQDTYQKAVAFIKDNVN